MRTVGNFDFPENAEEAQQWVKYSRFVALHSKVMCVAHTRIEGAWCAYIKPVPGVKHEAELEQVFAFGEKLSEKIALAIFPHFDGVPYAR